MGVSVLDVVHRIMYYPYMHSIVGKKRGNQTYYYLVESARVDGKPRIVDQQYLGNAEEVMARLTGAPEGSPRPPRGHRTSCAASCWGCPPGRLSAGPSPPRRCRGTAGPRSGVCRPPGRTPPGSSRSGSHASSQRLKAYMGNT